MQKTLALVLKKQNLGETDRILTVFSPTLGKKRVVAKAVRQPLSKLAGHLDTLMLSQLILTDSPELPRVTSAVLVEAFEELRTSLPKLDRAYAVSKLIERVILEDINQQTIFQLTLDTFVRINDDQPWLMNWLYCLSHLTAQLGLQISDFNCNRCGRPIRQAADFQLGEHRFNCQNCASDTADSVRLSDQAVKLFYLLTKRSFTELKAVVLPTAVAEQLEEVFLKEITQWFNKPWQSYRAT